MTDRELTAGLLDRLAKLIRMLASENEAEVLAATRAILRELQSEGADIHDLARLLSHDLPSSSVGGSAGFQTERMTRNISLVQCSECLLNANRLTESELAFVHALEQRLSGGAPFTRNEIQMLKSILDRVELAGTSAYSSD